VTTEIYAEVTFHVPDDKTKIDALNARAREIDEEEGNDIPEEYALAQALQVVWHLDPEWLHRNFLVGWTLDKAADDDGNMRLVWA
jgi:hypothetical protein